MDKDRLWEGQVVIESMYALHNFCFGIAHVEVIRYPKFVTRCLVPECGKRVRTTARRKVKAK